MTALISTCAKGSFSPHRRALLGAMLSCAVLPDASFAQLAQTPSKPEPKAVRIRLTFNERSMVATLLDNPSARDLVSLLPLNLTIDDYANNEKIAYLPRKLTQEGGGPFGNEAPGDLCYYAPWGNLALYHAGYRWSDGVIRLGRFEGGVEPLLALGKFPLRVERIP